MVCENTLENCPLFTNYSLVKVRIKLGCVKSVFRLCEARRTAWVEFVTLVVQSYFDILSRYVCV